MRHFTQYPCQSGVDNVKSPREFNDAVLADDVDLNFTGIFELFLYALGDVAREGVHREVCNLAGVHEDAYLAPRRYRIHLLHTGEGPR